MTTYDGYCLLMVVSVKKRERERVHAGIATLSLYYRTAKREKERYYELLYSRARERSSRARVEE